MNYFKLFEQRGRLFLILFVPMFNFYARESNSVVRQTENFALNRLYHKGNFAIKVQKMAGFLGSVTEAYDKIISRKRARMDYNNPDSYNNLLQLAWKEVNLPVGRVVEGVLYLTTRLVGNT